ncbi:hypothetical protein [Bacteroides sp.]
MKRIFGVVLLLVCWIGAAGQTAGTLYKDQVRVENFSAAKTDEGHLVITVDLVLKTTLKVKSNNVATLTPMLKADGHAKALPVIAVYGRRRGIVAEREKALPADTYTALRRRNKEEQKVHYVVSIPFEEWMNRSELVALADLCGCCNTVEEGTEEQLAQLDFLPKQPYSVQPQVAYITPNAEPIKRRVAEGRAFLDFPVNRTVVYPDYRKNPVELAKIRATIDAVRNDGDTRITGITIHGYASPEGGYVANARLAQGRAVALKNYVSSLYHFNDTIFQVNSTPEDWEGLRQFVAASVMDHRDEILSLIDKQNEDKDLKEARLRRLIGQEAYQYLLAECYPSLRHSDYSVRYVVRGFELEEARQRLLNRPQLLSMQEMYLVAQTYEAGSDDFNQVFRTAVAMFPNDPTANLNAAATELRKGDLQLAKEYLSKADPVQGATWNNRGVVALIEDHLDDAEICFRKAKELGIPQADVNIVELNRRKESLQNK